MREFYQHPNPIPQFEFGFSPIVRTGLTLCSLDEDFAEFLTFHLTPCHVIATMDIKELVEVDPEKMSGTPVFAGTRVPISHLFEYLEGGETVDEFVDQFPTVNREQVLGVLELSKESLLSHDEVAA